MTVQTGSGVDISIGTTAAASNATQFAADTYTVIGEVSESGEFGDVRQIVPFISLADGRVRKARGSKDGGEWQLTVAFDGSDAGQIAVKNAFAVVSQTADEYNWRVRLNDSGGINPTTFYFRGKVVSRPMQGISADNIITMAFTIAITSDQVEVAAA